MTRFVLQVVKFIAGCALSILLVSAIAGVFPAFQRHLFAAFRIYIEAAQLVEGLLRRQHLLAADKSLEDCPGWCTQVWSGCLLPALVRTYKIFTIIIFWSSRMWLTLECKLKAACRTI